MGAECQRSPQRIDVPQLASLIWSRTEQALFIDRPDHLALPHRREARRRRDGCGLQGGGHPTRTLRGAQIPAGRCRPGSPGPGAFPPRSPRRFECSAPLSPHSGEGLVLPAKKILSPQLVTFQFWRDEKMLRKIALTLLMLGFAFLAAKADSVLLVRPTQVISVQP